MIFYFAPLEGITGYVFRNRFNSYFGEDISRYYTPFIQAHEKCGLTNKEINDILPEHNKGIELIPQVMTNKSTEYFQVEPLIMEYGYKEINLNFGCPSKTVTTRFRGSGILSDPEMLDRLLYEIFEKTKCSVSVKTRIGVNETDEFENILSIYNKYELKELIIHPRVQKEFYNGKPHTEVFEYAVRNSKNPIIYNGNIFNKEDIYSDIIINNKAVMIGRGLLRNPGLCGEIKGKERIDKEVLKAFLTDLCNDYTESFSGDVPVLHKMKEIWSFMTLDVDRNAPFIYDVSLYKKLIKSKNVKEFLINQNRVIDAL